VVYYTGNQKLAQCVLRRSIRCIGYSTKEINHRLKTAADGALKGILGYEERPLVSVDYKDDPRSAIVGAPSTMVTDGT
jgi:glyceraldehyde-3-phosphate dehydrogenase/erythrose-4-phosphate dehydrogenase